MRGVGGGSNKPLDVDSEWHEAGEDDMCTL